jgi:hypothetical protein
MLRALRNHSSPGDNRVVLSSELAVPTFDPFNPISLKAKPRSPFGHYAARRAGCYLSARRSQPFRVAPSNPPMNSEFLTAPEIAEPSPLWVMAVSFLLTALFITALTFALPPQLAEARSAAAASARSQ